MGPEKGDAAKAPVKVGGELGMQEPHSEGVAHHADPESCAGGGNVAGEALTGENAGQVFSSAGHLNRRADPVLRRGRPHEAQRAARAALRRRGG